MAALRIGGMLAGAAALCYAEKFISAEILAKYATCFSCTVGLRTLQNYTRPQSDFVLRFDAA